MSVYSEHERDEMTACGGRQRYCGVDEVWDFGWIPPDALNPYERRAVEAIEAALPEFRIEGRTAAGEKAFLWECWKDPLVLQATGGRVYKGVHQLTGSCVGAGGGNAIFSLSAVEVVRLGDAEQALVPFWLLPYGRSRYHSGIRGRGDGSTGSGFAKAMLQDGIIPANLEGLPGYTDTDGLVWGSKAEMDWSDGARISDTWLSQSRKHLVKTAAKVRSADDVRAAILNGYPVGWCGSWGGLMQCEVKGSPPVLMNRRRGTWMHQQSCHGYWDHPELGEIYYILNQWGERAHGQDPAGGPAGGYWVSKADCDWQARNGDCYAFSAFEGFPAPDRPIPWVF